MIEVIEAMLFAALAPLPLRFPGLELRAGPGESPAQGMSVAVWALGLQHVSRATSGAELASPRLSARLAPLPEDTPRNWVLEDVEEALLTEVLAPDGRALICGDDYTIEPAGQGRTRLRLRAPLPGGAAPVVWARGAWAQGFHSTGACIVELSLVALAERASEADAVMGTALCLVLPVLAGLPSVEAPWGSFPQRLPPGAGLRARLLAPQISLREQSRRFVAGSPGQVRVESLLALTGTLSIEVATGPSEPGGVITAIVGTVDRATANIA